MGPLNGPDHGPVITTRNGEAVFRASFSKLIRDVALTHPDLADIKLALRADCIARSVIPLHTPETKQTSPVGRGHDIWSDTCAGPHQRPAPAVHEQDERIPVKPTDTPLHGQDAD